MITVNKKIDIVCRPTSDYFEQRNKEALSQMLITRPLGTSRAAIAAMLRNDEELKVLMPYVLGMSPANEVDQGWISAVSNYWNSLSYRINFPKQTWEIGMTFDVNDTHPIRKSFISALPSEHKKSDETLAAYVFGKKADGSPNVPAEMRYRYGIPIDVAEFLLWQFCLNYSGVANNKTLVDKSLKISFYLLDEEEAIKDRESTHKLKTEAMKLYIDLISKPQDVVDVLIVLRKDIPYDTPTNQKKIAREQLLEKEMINNTERFVEVCKSPTLKDAAKIEKYIAGGILKRLDNTNIVIDATDPKIIIGNNISEQIAFLSSTVNKDLAAEYEAKYKAQSQK